MNSLLSVNQVAFILKVHPLTVRRYIKEKKLKAVKVGGNVRILENDLQDFQKEVIPPPPHINSNVVVKVKKIIAKHFDENDPLLRLKGRGASLSLTKD